MALTRTLPLLLLSASLFYPTFAQGDLPLRLSPGDSISVVVSNFKEYSSEYTILSDGSVTGLGFGRIILSGKTLQQSRELIRASLAKKLRNPAVELILRGEKPKVVYFVGNVEAPAVVTWSSGLSIAKAIAGVNVSIPPDQATVTIYRKGKETTSASLESVLRGDARNFGQDLQPEDLISILPKRQIRIWVLGQVSKPGELQVTEGSDLYQAISLAGGINRGSSLDTEMELSLRRGLEITKYDAHFRNYKPVPLQAGDTIVVAAPEYVRVTLAGEITQPGEIILKKGASITSALALAKGKTPQGTLENIMLFRGGTLSLINAIHPQVEEKSLQNGDILFIQKSERIIYALGNVASPGPILLPEGKKFYAADVLSQAHGISGAGTLRRVILIRPDPLGKFAIKHQFNLDEYLKDGKTTSNPEVLPGDILYFGTPKGITANNILQGVSAALLIESLLRR